MNLGGKINFKKIDFKSIRYKILKFINKTRSFLFFIIFLTSVFHAGFIYYKYVYKYNWSEEEKKAYIETKQKDIVFDENKFNEVVRKIENKKEKFQNNIENVNDIFQLK